MQTTLQQTISTYPGKSIEPASLVKSFIKWCTGQERNRFVWLAGSLAGHGCFITPFTLMVIMLTGNSMLLWGFVIGAMGMVVAGAVAGLPTKFFVPAVLLSILIDLGVVVTGLMTVLSIG